MRLNNYLNESNQPTKEMVDFYEKRTSEHIKRVQKNLYTIAEERDDLNKVQLMARGKNHDKSKYGKEEKIPYIWLTWTKKYGLASISIPTNEFNIINKNINKAVNHHYKVNRHHPEFHKNINDMNEIDISEMIADWAAMSQELKDNLKAWTDKSVKKYKFNKDQTKLIYELIELFK